jgi:hypothetical protein
MTAGSAASSRSLDASSLMSRTSAARRSSPAPVVRSWMRASASRAYGAAYDERLQQRRTRYKENAEQDVRRVEAHGHRARRMGPAQREVRVPEREAARAKMLAREGQARQIVTCVPEEEDAFEAHRPPEEGGN